MEGHSEACCNTPPITVTGYEAKGKWETYGEYSTYVTGPADATQGIVFIYDIFGKGHSQTIQGADLLGTKFKVFMPDFLGETVADLSWFPPDTDEKAKMLGNFFATVAAPPKAAPAYTAAAQAIAAKETSITKWGVVGFCWGGKLVSLISSGAANPFDAVAEVHPAFVDPGDAAGIKVPLCMLASGDEPAEDVQKFKEALTVPSYIERFDDQIHGWMAARSDLTQARVKEEYERGYKTLITFFTKYL